MLRKLLFRAMSASDLHRARDSSWYVARIIQEQARPGDLMFIYRDFEDTFSTLPFYLGARCRLSRAPAATCSSAARPRRAANAFRPPSSCACNWSGGWPWPCTPAAPTSSSHWPPRGAGAWNGWATRWCSSMPDSQEGSLVLLRSPCKNICLLLLKLMQ